MRFEIVLLILGAGISTRPWVPTVEELAAMDNSKIKLHVHPQSILNGEDVVVSWSTTATASDKDYIGMSCGHVVNDTDYLETRDIRNRSVGSTRFHNLQYMRCNYSFVYYRYDRSTKRFTSAASAIVTTRAPFSAPIQGHIALTSNVDEMAVLFSSSVQDPAPAVEFGEAIDRLHLRTTGTSTTFKADDMCNEPATLTNQQNYRDPGFLHTVILKKLRPATRYFYRFGGQGGGWSDVYSFISRPTEQAVTKFIGYADMGVSLAPGSYSTVERVYDDVLDGYDNFLLHFGDISYALGRGFYWEKYMNQIEKYATRIPYMVSIGNHEYDHLAGGERDPSKAPGNGFHPAWGNYGSDSRGECGVPMIHRFHTPQNGNSLFWYSFNYGNVHVIQMSSEHDWTKHSEQYKWIENDLKSVNRSATPWVILTAHRMMYTTQIGELTDLTVSQHFRQEFEDLLYKYRVNLMLVGHQHSYERSCPVYKGECIPVGPVHVVVGSAGATVEATGFSPQIGNWSVANADAYGYLRLTATNDSLTVGFVLNTNGEIFDEFQVPFWIPDKTK